MEIKVSKVQLQNEILTLIEKEMDLDIPSVEMDLMETGFLDSLSFVQLLAVLEDQYDIEIDIDDLEFEYFRSIVKIAEFVEKKRADRFEVPVSIDSGQ
jgi:methoxymalonate biosynthesis acyl carrier protein